MSNESIEKAKLDKCKRSRPLNLSISALSCTKFSYSGLSNAQYQYNITASLYSLQLALIMQLSARVHQGEPESDWH